MKKMIRVLTAFLAVLLLSAAVLPAFGVGEDQPYAYNYDYRGNSLPCPSPYETGCRIDPGALGLGALKSAQGLFVRGDMLYIVDTGNSRILEFSLAEREPAFTREIAGGEGWTLSAPEDLFIDDDGVWYIADTGNQRVLILDGGLELQREIRKPDSAAYGAKAEFKPEKLVVTSGGRIYVQASGINKGLIEFNPDGSFSGYTGASPVAFDFVDYVWKRISTEAQRKQMESFVPTEYNNVALDREGFIFATIATFDVNDLLSGKAEVVRRLNLKGNNILVTIDEPVIGDTEWDRDIGPSRFVDVTVLDNDVYYLLDSTKNRIFAYDHQGNALYVFGGYGYREGYFQSPVAIEHRGHDLLVLDSVSGYVTVLTETGYGHTISSALENYNSGRYDDSYADWQRVLARNGNYRFAYDGIGKIMLRNGDYKEALSYLKYARDEYYYSKAWKLYRKDWIERNLVYFVIGIIALVVILWAVKLIRKEKEALREYEERQQVIAAGQSDS